MCGICGYYHPDPHYKVERDLLEKMNATLAHRGPDSQGMYLKNNLGMAMRRLAIIDIEGGEQPVSNEDSSVVVVFNGEIYNFRELRAELEGYGHQFSSNSDTEVIVHAYEEWQDDALLRFNGMFAFSLWDNHRKRLLLARDRMGKKPLYWTFSRKGLLWGSEAKALLSVPWVERHINPLALHHYLTLQYIPNPLTIFEGIHQLPAAHKLVIDEKGDPRVLRWWQLNYLPKYPDNADKIAIEAKSLLRAAVERRLISEVPLGAFLSGGIDSSIIVGLMAEMSDKPVKTFTIGFEEQNFSEAGYARQVAERYRTEHYEFLFKPDDLANLAESVIESTDEPFADPAALPLYELSRQAREHVTVALCGDGGDETLAGYRRYALDGMLRLYNALPEWFTQRAVPAAVGWLPEPAQIPEDRNPITGLKRLGQFSATTHKASLVRWGSYFSQSEKLALYPNGWHQDIIHMDTANWVAGYYDAALARSLLDRTLYADVSTYLPGDLLPKTDRMTMAHSLEGRSPFLDADWVEWTARLPERYKVRGKTTKWLLRSAFADLLPAEIAGRGKQGFGVPVGLWLRNDLQDWARQRLIGNSELDKWIRPDAVRHLLEEHDQGRVTHGERLWAILMFAVWMDRYSIC
jgi:asparagine synthase (glutamine-hydrolysing)